jgi:DNA-binding PadR family transcriptional regulator
MKELKKSHLKLVKFFSNGVTHNLILWIISKEPIHGYGIMKKLDEFFEFTNDNCELKSSSSKVYPILRKMEDNGLILGEWKTVNNKRLKFYSITEDGEIVLNHIRNNIGHVLENPNWLDFIEDMTGKKVELVNLNECN